MRQSSQVLSLAVEFDSHYNADFDNPAAINLARSGMTTATQSSTLDNYVAANAIDSNNATFNHTLTEWNEVRQDLQRNLTLLHSG